MNEQNTHQINNNLYGVFIIFFFMLLITYAWNSSKFLEESGGYNKIISAVVIKKQIKRGSMAKNIVYFEFNYQGKIYKDDNDGIKNFYFNSINTNDTIDIMINDKYPDYSLIFYDGNKHYWNGEK